MRRFPTLSYTGNASLKTTGSFLGLNKNLVIKDNEFSDMKNISSRFYPAIGTRLPRGAVQKTFSNPHGLYYKNGLFYIDGTKAYYKGTEVGKVNDSDKQIIGMGAYILLFPDKISFNTSSGVWKNLEVTFTPAGTVSFAPLSTDSAFTKISVAGIDGTFNRYDGVTISGCTNSAYNATKIISEIGSGYIIVAGTLDAAFTQTGGITFKRTVPDVDFVCESGNRIWGCSSKNHEIYGSKLGDPFNWNCFEGISTDSYAATVGSDGDFTGCFAHMGYVLFFKENVIHKLFGSKPSSFQLNTYTVPGIRSGCDKSVQVVNETLYFCGRYGVYTYDGSFPYLVSKNFGEMEISKAVSCQQNGKLYVSAYDGSGWKVFVYDPEYQIWDVEDETQFLFACYGDGTLYYIDSEKQLLTISGDTGESIGWVLESGDILEQSITNKYISKLLFNFWLSRGAFVNLYMKFDEDKIWQRKGTVSAEWDQTYSFPIIPKRCHKFKYRLEGIGEFKLLGLGRYVESGSEVIHGHIQY